MERKTIFTVMSGSIVAILLVFCVSCLNEETDIQPVTQADGPITYRMYFQGGIQGFDGVATRAGETWGNGDKLTIQFMQGSSRIVGSATYDAVKDEWTVSSAQSLSTNDEESCEVYFFMNPTQTSEYNVVIGKATISYADKQASYLIDEETGEIILRAQLAPITARLRLLGKAQSTYGVSGVKTFTSYSITDNRFQSSTAKLTGTLGSNGSSDYAYVLFADDATRKLTVDAFDTDGNPLGKACFTRSFEQTVLTPANSGRLTLPTAASMGNWQITNKDNGQEITQPSASAVSIGKVTYSAAPVQAVVSSVGNGTILATGFVYAKTSNPDLNSSKVSANAATAFSARITRLEEQTTYYVRAFVQNERTTILGPQQVFTTTSKPEGTSLERDDFDEEQRWD